MEGGGGVEDGRGGEGGVVLCGVWVCIIAGREMIPICCGHSDVGGGGGEVP